MPTLTIQRTAEFANRGRKFEIFIDDKSHGVITNGETKTYTLKNGTHRIVAKADWCSSPTCMVEFDKNNKMTTLQVRSFKFANILMPLGIILVVLHLILRYTLNFDYLIYPVGLIFIYFVYLLTFGRHRYLRLYVLKA